MYLCVFSGVWQEYHVWRCCMLRRCASPLLLILVLSAASLVGAQTPNPGNSRSAAPVVAKKPDPDPPPLPPDVVAPDPPAPDATQNGNPVTRTLKKLAPNCINAIFHACWSSPPQKPQPSQTAERKGAASREVGEYYFSRGNYHAAESRFRETLDENPNDARAMFELAQCLEKMNHIDQALEEYRACAEQQSSSPYAERSSKAVQRLTQTAATTQQ